MGIVPSAASGGFCGNATRKDAHLALVLGMDGNFPGVLAIENDEGYICDGLPYERSLSKNSLIRQR